MDHRDTTSLGGRNFGVSHEARSQRTNECIGMHILTHVEAEGKGDSVVQVDFEARVMVGARLFHVKWPKAEQARDNGRPLQDVAFTASVESTFENWGSFGLLVIDRCCMSYSTRAIATIRIRA